MAITMSVRRPGRTILVAIALFSLVAGTLVVRAIREPARATSSGSPYDVPLAVDTNPNPNVFETTITAQVATVDLGTGSGATVKAFTFNGTVPGPEIRIKPNDTVIVHFKNQLPAGQKTGIHWHGVELNNRSDGTAVTQNAVPPGGEYLYKFIAPRPGIFWYHPHHHLSTNQVFKGMYGSLIVADPNETTLQNNSKLPPQSETRTLVLSDTTVCKGAPEDTNTYNPGVPAFQSQPPPWSGFGAFPGQGGPTPEKLCKTPLNDDGIITATPLAAGDIPNIQVATAAGSIPVVEGQTVLTNGKNVGARGGSPTSPGALAPGASTLPVRAGQGVRFQVVNAATTR
ncbi:MAG TPA: multicopper oxidase domain-containing protein, partial [Acidimicrobiales bacterium]|nr:multicopper oxidase domain-containing protein [Acidimicrobiales bacterium]